MNTTAVLKCSECGDKPPALTTIKGRAGVLFVRECATCRRAVRQLVRELQTVHHERNAAVS